MSPPVDEPLDVTIISGMSGAGRSEAGNVLEDLGFFVIDNLPPMLIGKVAELAVGRDKPVRYALVVDVRSGDFLASLATSIDELRRHGARTRVLFLDAADDVLVRRYELSRRRHPLSETERVVDGIARERVLLEQLRGDADLLVDTSNLNVHELRDRLGELFADHDGAPGVQVNVVSFGYKHGLPLDVDLVFDCRFLPNPHWIEELRPHTGLDSDVSEYVLGQEVTPAFLAALESLLSFTMSGYEHEGKKAYLSIGVGCTGGRHRSVAIAEELAQRLRAGGVHTTVHHRDIERDSPMASVVALGGGHGLSFALRSVREYADEITAIVSVADDGGSSGRLRRALDVPAPGDLRRCLVALARDDGPWPRAFEHRFSAGELAGHALGNLVLVGLAETSGDLTSALAEAGRTLDAVGTVLPATVGPVSMTAQVGGRWVVGQVAIAEAGRNGRIHDVRLEPADAAPPPRALEAITEAQQIVLAPGSLYTSIVAVLGVELLRDAIKRAPGLVVQVANLATEDETTDHDGTDHLTAVLDHGGRVDAFLYDPDHGLAVDTDAVTRLGVRPVAAPIARPDGSGHDSVQLAQALSALL